MKQDLTSLYGKFMRSEVPEQRPTDPLKELTSHVKAMRAYMVQNMGVITDPFFYAALKTLRDLCDSLGVPYDSI